MVHYIIFKVLSFRSYDLRPSFTHQMDSMPVDFRFEAIHSSIHFSISLKDWKWCLMTFFTGSATCGRALSWSKISLSYRLAYSDRFFSMLGSVSSIVVYSEQLWLFNLVSATRGIPYLLDPTKYTASPFEHAYWVFALMYPAPGSAHAFYRFEFS